MIDKQVIVKFKNRNYNWHNRIWTWNNMVVSTALSQELNSYCLKNGLLTEEDVNPARLMIPIANEEIT